ncbi:MAG TPA: T9SS type A sorting domain-containing protein, partial [Luteibaculaceae bacterium]|nr:T9SS type A sorting domain-containing protein [Luteibaculaceae bacterium]
TANRTLVVKTAGNYSVTYTDVNGCVSTSASTSVTTNPVPNKPQVQFLGKSNTCAGDSVLLFVNNPNGDALLWNDAAGTTNDTLVVKTAGNYFVVASAAGCSNQSDPVSVPFDFSPDRPVITPLGSTLLCEGDQLQITSSYSTGIVWSTGETNDTITLSNTGTYSVTYTDPAGCASVSELFSVSFTPAPPKPGIILVGDSLRSTVESFTYQWIGPFGPINGATNRSYKPTTTGDYRVVVYTLEGCTSEQSDPYYIGFTGVNEWKGGMVALYPNPVADKLTVEHSEQDVYSFEIYNALGRMVKHLVSSDKRVVFDLSDLAAGPYQFRMVGSNGAITKTIIRQ